MPFGTTTLTTTETGQHRKLTDWKQRWPLLSEVSAHAAQQTVSEIHENTETRNGRRENGHETGRLKWQESGDRRSLAYH
jgi:putative transposase